MVKLKYDTEIKASRAVVWETLTDSEKFKQWVKAFSPNSYYDGVWKQGTYIKFLDSNMGGTKAILEIVEPHNRILAKHVSTITKEGVEETTGDMASKWIGTIEDYALIENKGKTHLDITIETHNDFVDMFESGWPKAIKTIKELSEKTNG